MRKGVIIVGLLSALILTGCSNSNNASKTNNSAKTTATKGAAVKYYQKLDKADKKKIKFSFKATKAKGGYDIAVKIKNETKRSVKFDLSQIKIASASGKLSSSKRDEKLVVKAHETCTVKRLFENMSVEKLNDSSNYFVYQDVKNILSKFNFDIAVGTDTKEANQLVSSNANKPTTSSEVPKTAEKTPTKPGSSTSNAEAKPNTPARILTSSDMAKALYLHSMGFSDKRGEGITATQTAKGYTIVDDSMGGNLDMTIYYNFAGDELDANGNVIATFAQLSGPTAAQPDGFYHNGSNYNKY